MAVQVPFAVRWIGAEVHNGFFSLPALRYGFVEDPNGIRVEIVTRLMKP